MTVEERMQERMGVLEREVVTMVLSLTTAELKGVLEWYKAADSSLPLGLIRFAAAARQGYALRLLDCTDDLAEIRLGASA